VGGVVTAACSFIALILAATPPGVEEAGSLVGGVVTAACSFIALILAATPPGVEEAGSLGDAA
jgi:hypothetical protein